MAKTAIKKGGQTAGSKDFVKVIKAVRSEKTGAYTFREVMIHKDEADKFLKEG